MDRCGTTNSSLKSLDKQYRNRDTSQYISNRYYNIGSEVNGEFNIFCSLVLNICYLV